MCQMLLCYQNLYCHTSTLTQCILHMDELPYLVAREKWFSVWHNTGSADNKVTAKYFAIGQLNIDWPGS